METTTQIQRKLKVVIMLDTTASMGPSIQALSRKASEILEIVSVFEGIDAMLVTYKDHDMKENGIAVFDNIKSSETFKTILNGIRPSGGGRGRDREAICTAMWEAVHHISPEYYSSVLVYVLTDEGGRFEVKGKNPGYVHPEIDVYNKALERYGQARFGEKPRIIKSGNNLASCLKGRKLTPTDMEASSVATELNRINAKVMVLSNRRGAFTETDGFVNLEKAYNNLCSSSSNRLFKGLQLVYSSDNDKLAEMISQDILVSITDTYQCEESQSFFGNNVSSMEEVEKAFTLMGLESSETELMRSLVTKRMNTIASVFAFPSEKSDFLHFSTTSLQRKRHDEKYDTLMLFPTVEKADVFVNHLVENQAMLKLIANNEYLGSFIRSFVDDFASAATKTVYYNSLRGNTTKVQAAAQQKRRIANVASSLVQSAIDGCHKSEHGLFFISHPAPLTDSSNIINMVSSSALKFMEEKCMKNIGHRPNRIGQEPPAVSSTFPKEDKTVKGFDMPSLFDDESLVEEKLAKGNRVPVPKETEIPNISSISSSNSNSIKDRDTSSNPNPTSASTTSPKVEKKHSSVFKKSNFLMKKEKRSSSNRVDKKRKRCIMDEHSVCEDATTPKKNCVKALEPDEEEELLEGIGFDKLEDGAPINAKSGSTIFKSDLDNMSDDEEDENYSDSEDESGGEEEEDEEEEEYGEGDGDEEDEDDDDEDSDDDSSSSEDENED